MGNERNLLFTYGSLMVEPNFLCSVRLKNYKRSWEVLIKEIKVTSLGISNKDGANCNGLIYEVDGGKLQELDIRETNSYKRVEINRDYIELIEGDLPEGRIWTYITKIPQGPTKDSPILMSYVEVILTGCINIGEGFTKEFLESTYDWRFIEGDLKKP